MESKWSQSRQSPSGPLTAPLRVYLCLPSDTLPAALSEASIGQAFLHVGPRHCAGRVQPCLQTRAAQQSGQ